MCWEETEETVIHEDISQWGTAEGKTTYFLLMGLTLYGEIYNTRHLLGEICKEIYITKSRRHDKQKIYGEKCNMNI